MSSPEAKAHAIFDSLDVNYVLVVFGGMVRTSIIARTLPSMSRFEDVYLVRCFERSQAKASFVLLVFCGMVRACARCAFIYVRLCM
jgi:hypothetical protein